MKIDEIVSEVQRVLRLEVDGKPGPQTWSAIYDAIVRPTLPKRAPAVVIAEVDPRSEKCISTLAEEARPLARALVQKAATAGIRIKVISGTRSIAEQNALYAQGRSKPGNRVTNVQGGYSNHNFGIAFDIGVFEGNQYLAESPKYKAVGALGMELGLEWGGTWKTIVDEPHFQLRPAWAKDLTEKQMLAELRARVASNTPIFK